jgi:hypothetical protein
MEARIPTARRARLLAATAGAVLVVLFVALACASLASATTTPSPVTWVPGDSTYGSSGTPFVALPSPAPAGTGATSFGPGAAYGAGFWDSCAGVYVMGFVNSVPTSLGLPGLAQTELSATALTAGVPLTLVFDKTAGQRVDSVAILGDPDALVSIDPSDPTALTAATRFTVQATVADPVQSYSGDVAAAFGLLVDCSASAARDYQNSLFVTNMHWLDIDPPTFTAAGMAGLTAHGSNGSVATFDGIFTPAFLTAMGISDPTQVQGYVDLTTVTGWTNATFAVLGQGDGSLWPSGWWKYRVTNGTWCTHTIMFGQLTRPASPIVVGPKGVIGSARPTLKWRRVGTAARYEVRVYRRGTLIMRKTGLTALQWRTSRALPKGVWLTWKVRGSNALGAGTWSTAPRFKVS